MRRAFCLVSMRLLGLSVSSPFLLPLQLSRILRTRADAFIRDELSKGRYDPAISKSCFEMLLELFNRTLKLDLGDHDGKKLEIEDVC